MAARFSSSFFKISAEYSCKRLTVCRTNIFTEIKFPFVKTTDSKAFNMMIIKLDPAETTLTRSRLHSIKYTLESWSGAFEYWSGVLKWNSIIIKIHLNCMIYQTFNRLSVGGAIVQFYLHVLPGLIAVLGQCG